MKQVKTVFLCLGMLIAGAPIISHADSAEDIAVEAAQAWLGLVDSGEYAQSWNTAAELFRNAITAADWDRAVRAARQPLGKVESREIDSAQYAASLPGAPDGEYVVIQFKTRFENKGAAVETVTPMRDPDGQWRVSGYYIK